MGIRMAVWFWISTAIANEQFGVGKLTVSHQSVSVDDIICISVLLQT